jgi:hypothetical protein
MKLERNENAEIVFTMDTDAILAIYHLVSVDVDRLSRAGIHPGVIAEMPVARIKRLIGDYFKHEETSRRQACEKKKGFLSKLFRFG